MALKFPGEACFFFVEAMGALVAVPFVIASPRQPAGLYFTGLLDGILVLIALSSMLIAGIG